MKRHSLTQRALAGAENIRNRIKRRKSDDVSAATPGADDTSQGATSNSDKRQSLTDCSTSVDNVLSPDGKPKLAKEDSVDSSGDDVSGHGAHARLRRERSDDGINDSITNMSLLTNALYDMTCAASRYVWLFLRSSVAFIYNSIMAAVTSRDDSASTDGGPSGDGGGGERSRPKSVTPAAPVDEAVSVTSLQQERSRTVPRDLGSPHKPSPFRRSLISNCNLGFLQGGFFLKATMVVTVLVGLSTFKNNF